MLPRKNYKRIHLEKLCELYKEMEKDSPGFPPPASLTGRRKPNSYFVLTDKAYAVQENIMKVFCGICQKGPIETLFNYLLPRTHRVVKKMCLESLPRFPEYYGSHWCYNQKSKTYSNDH